MAYTPIPSEVGVSLSVFCKKASLINGMLLCAWVHYGAKSTALSEDLSPPSSRVSPQADSVSAPSPAASIVDYETYDHRISLEAFRSGNHNPEGSSRYSIQLTLNSYLKTKEELRLEEPQKKTKSREVGHFFSLQLPSLTLWKPNAKEKERAMVHVKGNEIRALISETMDAFGVREHEVAIKVRLTMLVSAKRYYILEDDFPIGEGSYDPIPLESDKLRQNADVSMTDPKGGFAKLKVVFPPMTGEVKSDDEATTP